MPRRPPHFKAFTTTKNHHQLRHVYQDNDLLALWLRLGIEAIERFADRTDDSFLVGDRELLALTGKGRADVARRLLERLADLSPISAERDGDVWRIGFHNLAKRHGFGVKNGSSRGTYADADADADASPPKGGPQVPVSKPKSRKRPAVPFPCPMPLEDADALCAWAKRKHGMSQREVRQSVEKIRGWALAGDKRRVRWVQACQNYINDGWARVGGSTGEVPSGLAYRPAEEVMAQKRREAGDP